MSALPPLIQEYRAKADQLLAEQKKVKASTKDMVDTTDRETSRMSGIFGGAAKAAAGIALGVAAAGAAALTAIVKVGLQEAADASAMNAQLNAGIASTGNAANVTVDGMNALAASIQAYSGQTDDSIAQTEALLLTFTNIKNVGADKIFDDTTRAAADMAARLGGDAASQAIVLGKALNDPIDGLSKLTRVGVTFTQAQKDQVAAMTAAGDTIGAQKIILAELNTEFGGSAEAAGKSLPGSLNRAKRAFEDLSQAVVEKFLPIVTPAISFLVDKLQVLAPIAENVAGRIATAISGGGAGIADLFNSIGSTIAKFISGGGLIAAFNTGADLRDKLFNGVMSALPGILDAIIGFIPQLIGFITGTLIPQFVEQFVTLVNSVVQIIVTLVPKLVEALVAAIPLLLDGAINMFLSIVNAVLEVLPQIIEALVGLLPLLIQAIVDMIPDLISGALKLFNGILTALVKAIPIIITALVKAIPLLITALVDAIPAIIDGALSLFMGIIAGLGKAIPQIIVALVKAIPQLVLALVGALPDLIDGAIQLFLGIITGLVTAIPEIIKAVVAAVPMIVQALIDATPLLLEAGVQLIGALIGGLISAGSGVASALNGIIGNAINGVIDLINGAISGINDLTRGISDATGGAINIRLASLPHLSFDVGTGRVPGPDGTPVPAVVHGGEAVLSNDMIAGNKPIPSRVVDAVDRQQRGGNGAPAPAPASGGGHSVVVMVEKDPSAAKIAREVGWELRRMG